MTIVIEAINEVYSIENNKNVKLFLAGGITNCSDHQSKLIKLLEDCNNLTIYNPRRQNFPIDDPNASEQQITWEYNHLMNADIISFWFDSGSLNPIVLLELGKYALSSSKPIFIGIDPEYKRIQDVQIQTRLSRPDVEIVYSIKELSEQIKKFIS